MSDAKARSDAPVAENVPGGGHVIAAPPRDRKPGAGLLKRLKSRRNQMESRPVTEEDLQTQSGHITPEDVFGLRVAARGLSLPRSLVSGLVPRCGFTDDGECAAWAQSTTIGT